MTLWIPPGPPDHPIRDTAAALAAEFPGWRFRHDSHAGRWIGATPVEGGSVGFEAPTADSLRALIHAARGQTLVIP